MDSEPPPPPSPPRHRPPPDNDDDDSPKSSTGGTSPTGKPKGRHIRPHGRDAHDTGHDVVGQRLSAESDAPSDDDESRDDARTPTSNRSAAEENDDGGVAERVLQPDEPAPGAGQLVAWSPNAFREFQGVPQDSRSISDASEAPTVEPSLGAAQGHHTPAQARRHSPRRSSSSTPPSRRCDHDRRQRQNADASWRRSRSLGSPDESPTADDGEDAYWTPRAGQRHPRLQRTTGERRRREGQFNEWTGSERFNRRHRAAVRANGGRRITFHAPLVQGQRRCQGSDSSDESAASPTSSESSNDENVSLYSPSGSEASEAAPTPDQPPETRQAQRTPARGRTGTVLASIRSSISTWSSSSSSSPSLPSQDEQSPQEEASSALAFNSPTLSESDSSSFSLPPSYFDHSSSRTPQVQSSPTSVSSLQRSDSGTGAVMSEEVTPLVAHEQDQPGSESESTPTTGIGEEVWDEDVGVDPNARSVEFEFHQDQVYEHDSKYEMEPDDGNAQEQGIESEMEEEEREEEEETGKPAAATPALVVRAYQHQQLGMYEDAAVFSSNSSPQPDPVVGASPVSTESLASGTETTVESEAESQVVGRSSKPSLLITPTASSARYREHHQSHVSDVRPVVERQVQVVHSPSTPAPSPGSESIESGYGADTDTSTPSTVLNNDRIDESDDQDDERSESGQSETSLFEETAGSQSPSLLSPSRPGSENYSTSTVYNNDQVRRSDGSKAPEVERSEGGQNDASLFEAAGSPSPSLLSPRTLASEDRSTSGPEAGGENSSNASPGIPEDRRQSNTTVLQGDQARGSLQSEVPRESEDPYEVRAVISNIETLESPFRSSRNSSPSGYDAEDQHSCNSRRIDESHRQRDFFPMGSNYIGDEQNQQVFFEHERGDEEFDVAASSNVTTSFAESITTSGSTFGGSPVNRSQQVVSNNCNQVLASGTVQADDSRRQSSILDSEPEAAQEEEGGGGVESNTRSGSVANVILQEPDVAALLQLAQGRPSMNEPGSPTPNVIDASTLGIPSPLSNASLSPSPSMTGEAEKLQGDPTIAHSESPTKRRIEHPTETHTGQPTQRASGPSELPTWHPTSMFAESPNETPTNTPTEIQTVAPTEPPTDPTIEPPTESRSEAESQHMIRDRDEKSKTSDSAKPDEEETKVSETSQGSVDLDRSVAHLERVEIIASHDETALPAPQILFDGGEMSTTASPSALTAHHAVREMNPIPRSSERIQITQDLNMHQPPVEDSSRASTSMYLEEPPLASPGAVAADGETARPGQRTSTQTVEPGYGSNEELANDNERAPVVRVVPFPRLQAFVADRVPALRPFVDRPAPTLGPHVRQVAEEVRGHVSRVLTHLPWGRPPASSEGQENQGGGPGNQPGTSVRQGGGQYEAGCNHLSKPCGKEKHDD